MKKYLGLSTILATSVLLTACTDDNQATPSKPTSGNTTITSSTNSSSASTTKTSGSNTETPNTEVTTQSQTATGQTAPSTTATSKASSSKINLGAIADGNLASVVGTYPALNGGTYTIKDNKTIVYTVDGEEKILTITGYGQQEGVAVANAVFSSIGGKPVDASAPSPGGNGAVFYFVPAGQKSPLGFFGGTEDTSRDRVVTLNNAFYLK